MSSDTDQHWLRSLVLGREDLPDPDWPTDHVPQDARRSLLSISAVLLGFVFFTGTLFAGAEVGAALGFGPMLAALAVGSAVLGLYVATLCAVGAQTGLTTVLLSRYTFGRLGAKWADLLLGGTQVGWFGVTIPLIAVPTAQYFGVETPGWVAFLIVLWGLFHLATAYFGYEGMEKLSLVAVPLLVLIGVLSIAIALGDVGGLGGLMATTGSAESMGFGAAVTIVIGTFVSGGTQAPNWARFAGSRRTGFAAGLVAFLVGNSFLFISGAIGGAVYANTGGDLYRILSVQGLAGIGLVALAFAIWTTNDNAAYAFGVAGSEAFDYDRKRPFVLAGGIVGIGLALLGIADLLIPWLGTLGRYVPPLGGVLIADFLFCWRLDVPRMEEIEFTSVRAVPVFAYVVGCVVAVFTAGAVAPGVSAAQLLPGITALNGILAAMIVQIVGHYALEETGVVATHASDGS